MGSRIKKLSALLAIQLQRIIDGEHITSNSEERLEIYKKIHGILEAGSGLEDFHATSLPSSIVLLQRFCEQVHKDFEIANARRFAGWERFLDLMPPDKVLIAANHEEKMLNFAEDSRVAFIGCGPCPYSALTFMSLAIARNLNTRTKADGLISSAQYYDARRLLMDAVRTSPRLPSVNCIDSDQSSCEIAANVLVKASCMNSVSTLAFGEEYMLDVNEKSVFVAAAVTNKRLVVANVLEQLLNWSSKGIVVVRSVARKSPLAVIYEPFEVTDIQPNLVDDCRVTTGFFTPPGSCFSSTSVFVHAAK